MVTAIIAAAGSGRRMGSAINKVLLPLLGQPVLIHSIMTFSRCAAVDNLIIVASPQDVPAIEALISGCKGIKPCQVITGGSERQYSIYNALQVLPHNTRLVLVHDGARPLIELNVISAVVAAAEKYRAAGVAVPVKDTIKRVDEHGFIVDTPLRKNLWAIQTPQAFEAPLLKRAYEQALADGFLGTDDASLVERLGVPVKLVEGSYSNIKLTTPEDMLLAKALLRQEDKDIMRFGIGYDVHQLVEGRKLVLGGVEISHSPGLLGHSDADVLLHAIKDALLGAAALGDIGRHFPDSDSRYKGVSSLVLLKQVGDMLTEHGYSVNNIDATIVAQKPKLAAHIGTMNANIARALGLKVNQVNIKATTTEGLGFAGRSEGIAAYAVASIVRTAG